MTGKPAAVSPEFAAAMQHLSAEARKSAAGAVQTSRSSAESGAAFGALEARVSSLEQTLLKKIDDLTEAVVRSNRADEADRFRNIEEQLIAVRNTESVNQRLFDSLHEELLKYRDNFVHESLQKPFIHDLVHLFDDLNSLASQLASSVRDQKQTKIGHVTQWSDNLDNAIHALIEILHRLEVKEIEPKETVDRALHRVISYEPTEYPEEDGMIVMRIKRGFSWRGNLIRPEEVIAKRYN